MNYLFYSKNSNDLTHALLSVIKSVVPPGRLIFHQSMDDLLLKLHQLNNNIGIAVLMIDDREEFANLMHLKDLFADMRIILVLPDRERCTISKAHLLGPRYLAYTDSSFEDVKAVLQKMQRA